MSKSDGSIFVSIASYRDPDCQWTVKDLFEKASRPDRIFVGICWQTIPEEDTRCFEVETRPDQVRRIDFHATRDSLGACWARHQAGKLYDGEEYFFQIDSHCRFHPGWDDRLIEMLKACPSPRPVLTTYPVGFVPPDQLGERRITFLTADRFHDTGVLINGSRVIDLDLAPGAPIPTALLAAGQIFGPGSMVRDVPYDPHLYFQGEEISLAVRLWTHGFDLFIPNDCVLFHDYSENRNGLRHWSDNRDWHGLSVKAAKRVMHMLGTKTSNDPEILDEIEKFGLGSVRSLEAYQRYSGIDFKNSRISPRAAEGKFPMPFAEDEGLTARLTDIYVHNRFGGKETRSGSGSTLASTRDLRARMLQIWGDLGIRRLIDAGCGDLNWIEPVSQGLELYIGLDAVEELTERNRILFRHRKNHFFQEFDVAREIPVAADAILCRDTLTHLPDAMVKRALGNFRQSGATWLLATTYTSGENRDIAIGGWRPLNLQAPPFSLPPPRHLIEDGAPKLGKSIGVWALAHLEI